MQLDPMQWKSRHRFVVAMTIEATAPCSLEIADINISVHMCLQSNDVVGLGNVTLVCSHNPTTLRARVRCPN